MKNREYHMSKMKKDLISREQYGVEYVDWRLTNEQLEIIRKWGRKVVPQLYSIQTRCFSNVRNLPRLLKDLHYANKKGKKIVTIPYWKLDRKLLEANRVRYWPVKYRIYLKHCKSS